MSEKFSDDEARSIKRIKVPALRLSDLPTDILALIIEYLELFDYVMLVNTNKELRQALDIDYFFQKLWRAEFSTLTKAYHVPQSDDELMIGGWRAFTQRLKSLNSAIIEAEKEIRSLPDTICTLDRQTEAIRVTNPLVERFACDKYYFIPLLFYSRYKARKLRTSLEKFGCSSLIFGYCLANRLLHLLNVRIALDFFQDARASDTDDIEWCLLEMSRFDFGFNTLGKLKLPRLRRVHKEVGEMIKSNYSKMEFRSEARFEKFIIHVGQVVLKGLNRPTPGGSTYSKSFRMFEDWYIQHDIFVFAIFGDILTRILSCPVMINGKLVRPKVTIGRGSIHVGFWRHFLDHGTQEWHIVFARNEPPLNYEETLELCIVPPDQFILPGYEENVPIFENRHLWNATVRSVLSILRSDDIKPMKDIIGDIRFDVKDIETMRIYYWLDSALYYPPSEYLVMSKDVCGFIELSTEGTVIFTPKTITATREPPKHQSYTLDWQDIFGFMRARGPNYLGIIGLRHLSTNFIFKSWREVSGGYQAEYHMQ